MCHLFWMSKNTFQAHNSLVQLFIYFYYYILFNFYWEFISNAMTFIYFKGDLSAQIFFWATLYIYNFNAAEFNYMKSCLPELTSKIPLISVVVPFKKRQKYNESEKNHLK